jgi:hypothetical protein
MGPVRSAALELLQGDFEDRRTLAGQGPAAQPAAVAAVVNADHLIELLALGLLAARWAGGAGGELSSADGQTVDGDGAETDTASLLEVHGWTESCRFA